MTVELKREGVASPRTSVRHDFLPKDAYLSKDFLRRENERMWPRVWQIACRVEELAKVGDYIVYDIGDNSIIVVRENEDRIRGYHNTCSHRGRQLVEGAGRAGQFRCKFHGWRYNLDGACIDVQDREDFASSTCVSDDELRLKEVLIDTWAGFVFINMDLNAEPLQNFLDPVPTFLDPFEMQKWRYRWYKTTVLPCNWKVVLEGFNESYHVAATHPQLLQHMGDDVTRSYAYGKHGMYLYPPGRRSVGTPSPRTGQPVPDDVRPVIVRHFNELSHTLKAMYTERAVAATGRLLTEVPATASIEEVYTKLGQFHQEAAEASGAGWPDISYEQWVKAGINWHIFPNHVFLQLKDGSIAYRARPNGDDPDSCIFDIWSLVRYTPGTEPPLKREFYPDFRDKTVERFGYILSQDFGNFGAVQKGMKSMAFQGSRINPLQESELSNMHRVLREYLFDE
jgi:phenylpropionate dioxygenase-like ring-hydroxylating dioxygenase large terminal subunit